MTDSELKKDVRERIIKARTDGVSTGRMANIAGDGISIEVIYGMIGAIPVPIESWQKMDKVLKKMGY